MQHPKTAAAVLAALFAAGSASAVSVPFVEDYPANVSAWEDSIQNPLVHSVAGGPDGGAYATTTFDYSTFTVPPFGGGPVIFRANDSDNASGDAFVGDWVAAGVDSISIYVRHDAPVALTYFVRVATNFNFPGAVFDTTQLVPPNTWTQVVVPMDPLDPLCTGETVTCFEALQSVGNFQVGTNVPPELEDLDADIHLDIDKVQVVPEPTAALQLVAGTGTLVALGRRRGARKG